MKNYGLGFRKNSLLSDDQMQIVQSKQFEFSKYIMWKKEYCIVSETYLIWSVCERLSKLAATMALSDLGSKLQRLWLRNSLRY